MSDKRFITVNPEELDGLLKAQEKRELQKAEEIEKLLSQVLKNATTLGGAETAKRVKMERFKLCKSLIKSINEKRSTNYSHPYPYTTDCYVQMIRNKEKVIRESMVLHEHVTKRLMETQEDIKYLQTKLDGLEKMEEANLNSTKFVEQENISKKYRAVKHYFQDVKRDLHTVVQKLFPDNKVMNEVLGDLTRRYNEGGDDIYVDVTADNLEVAHFLLEANIAVYHRNIKSKIRLAEML